MARLLRGPWWRKDTSQYSPNEGDILQPAAGLQLRGMDSELPLNLLDPAVARLVRNLNIRNGAYQLRDTIAGLGATAASAICGLAEFRTSTDPHVPFRVCETNVDVFVTGVWITVSGPGTYGDANEPFAYAGWGNTVMFAAGVGKVWSIDSGAGPVAEIADSPTDVIHLTVFDNRAVAIVDDGVGLNQVQWSVRVDNTDWTGLGSGYEDLKAAPGGREDKSVAVIPITDETAYLVRTNSIWQVNVTGDFDAPLAFNRLYENIGGKYPQLCVGITHGLICVDDDHIWMITPAGPKDIGKAIKSYLKDPANDLSIASATYDPIWREFRMGFISGKVLRYSIENDAWTEDSYNFAIRSISYSVFQGPGTLYGEFGLGTYKDDPVYTSVTEGFRIETADLKKTDASTKKELVEVILWYESEGTTTLYFEYSTDGGVTWIPLAESPIVATTRPQPLSVTKTIDRDFIQLACFSTVTPRVRLIKIEPMVREAGKITDAH